MNMDKMIGNDFEQGLANLKRVVESQPPAPPPTAAAVPANPVPEKKN
jgi:hypothetical protein